MKNEEITIYWWNMGTKTLDFAGTINDYLINKNITYKKIKHGFKFKISLSGCVVNFQSLNSFDNASVDAIKIFLLLLGDKSLFRVSGRQYKINYN